MFHNELMQSNTLCDDYLNNADNLEHDCNSERRSIFGNQPDFLTLVSSPLSHPVDPSPLEDNSAMDVSMDGPPDDFQSYSTPEDSNPNPEKKNTADNKIRTTTYHPFMNGNVLIILVGLF